MGRTIAWVVAALFAATPTPAPNPSPTATTLIYAGNPATKMTIESRPLGFDPDGNANWLVVTHFFDAQGNPTRIMANSDLDWISNDGYVQWQTRMRYGQPAAILKTHRDGPLAMTVRANAPPLGSVTVRTDTHSWIGPRVVAQALGPHALQIGWFPAEPRFVRIIRIDQRGRRSTVAMIAGASSNFRDTGVTPGERYRYEVYPASGRAIGLLPIAVPAEPSQTRISNASGKAMWLYFTTNPIDDIYYAHMDPAKIVDQAVRAGLHYVELRTAYGAYWEVSAEAKPTIDAIIDGLAAHGIGTIGWTVPRDNSFQDLQASVQTAYYRTAKGTPLTGLALDLERGDEFMGGDPLGLPALWQYMRSLREALGPHYLLVSTVEDAYMEHLDNRTYPFRQIAQFSDVLQPMAYWRMLRKHPTTPQQVRVLLRASYDKLLRESQRKLAVSVGGQTSAEGPNGYPPASEITASLQASKEIGAIGECFFDWDGTQPYQWEALANYPW